MTSAFALKDPSSYQCFCSWVFTWLQNINPFTQFLHLSKTYFYVPINICAIFFLFFLFPKLLPNHQFQLLILWNVSEFNFTPTTFAFRCPNSHQCFCSWTFTWLPNINPLPQFLNLSKKLFLCSNKCTCKLFPILFSLPQLLPNP